MRYVVAYDIESDRIRTRLARFLEKSGARLQKSVFAVEVERHAFRTFVRQLGKLAGKDGKVAIFPLCAGCRDRSVHMGPELPKYYVV